MASEEKRRRTRLLHLPRGVTCDLIKAPEDILEERLLEGIKEPLRKPISQYDQLPDEFVVGNEVPAMGGKPKLYTPWPQSCNLRCISCTLTFPNSPFFIPYSIEKTTETDIDERGQKKIVPATVYRRLGVTCTANCAVTYIETHMKGDYAMQAKENVIHLYYAMHGVRVLRIVAAPPHTELEAYGGRLTDKEFWEALHKLDPRHGIPSYEKTLGIGDSAANASDTAWSIRIEDPAEVEVEESPHSPERQEIPVAKTPQRPEKCPSEPQTRPNPGLRKESSRTPRDSEIEDLLASIL